MNPLRANENQIFVTVVDDGTISSGEQSHNSKSNPLIPFQLATQLVNSFVENKFIQSNNRSNLQKETIIKPFPVRGAGGAIVFNSLQGFSDQLLAMKLDQMDVIIITFSVIVPESLQNAMKWLKVLINCAPYLPIVLAGDDADKRESHKGPIVLREEGKKCSKKLGASAYVEYSTSRYNGIVELFEQVVLCALQGRERGKPSFTMSEAKTKSEFQAVISQLYLHQNVEAHRKQFQQLLGKFTKKKRGLTHIDFCGLNLTEDQLSFILPYVFLAIKGSVELDLSFNRLHKVPVALLSYVSVIKVLSVEANQLQTLPPELHQIDMVKWKDNPLILIPETFRNPASGWYRLRSYLQSITKRSTKWHEIKLLLIGQEGVGKTTLLKCFKNPRNRTDIRENLSTDGVNITRGLGLGEASSKVQFNVWDLGGQEIFYPTHQFFLTSNSIYVLCFNLSNPTESRVEYWMRQIRALSNNSRKAPIFIVGTHADHPDLNADSCAALLNSIAQKFPTSTYRGLQSIQAVSCKTGMGVSDLKSRIERVAQESWFQPEISETWIALHEYVSSKRESGLDKVSWSTYCEWAEDLGVPETELEVLTQFLVDVGTLVHFNDRKQTALNDLVVLNPQWLADLMSSLITFKHSWVKRGKIFRGDLFQHVFQAYPPESHQQLVALLERFSVIYWSKNEPDILIVPSLLPEELDANQIRIAKEIWHDAIPKKYSQYGRVYKFPFLPLGFFDKIIVRLLHSEHVIGHLFWRQGVFVQCADQIGKLEYLPGLNEFRVWVREPQSDLIKNKRRHLLIREIVDSVETLIECFYRMNQADLSREIPCPKCLPPQRADSVTQKITHGFSYETLIETLSVKKPLQCGTTKLEPLELAPDVAFSDMVLIEDSQLTIQRKIGEGGFGAVYLGEYRGSRVAVKELLTPKESSSKSSQFQSFQQEAFVMSCLNHENLVRLWGICLHPLRMVLELVPRGDLFDFLHPKCGNGVRGTISKDQFPWKLRLRIATDIARGMEYLQSFSPPIVHRDLRSPNIFLMSLDPGAEVCAKVADFGLSRMVAPSLGGALGTWQWLAPEVFNANEYDQYDEHADRFSFAIVCWEIATRQFPYSEFEEDKNFSVLRKDGTWELNLMKIKQAVCEGLRPSFPSGSEEIPPGFVDLIQKCWDPVPQNRPPFQYVISHLEYIARIELGGKKAKSPEMTLTSSQAAHALGVGGGGENLRFGAGYGANPAANPLPPNRGSNIRPPPPSSGNPNPVPQSGASPIRRNTIQAPAPPSLGYPQVSVPDRAKDDQTASSGGGGSRLWGRRKGKKKSSTGAETVDTFIPEQGFHSSGPPKSEPLSHSLDAPLTSSQDSLEPESHKRSWKKKFRK